MAERLLRAIGRADLVDDPRFRADAARLAHRKELEAIVRKFIAARTQAEALAFFEAAEALALAQGGVVGRARDPT
jgi:crotonobetainyl-CoA:carnitine CoA-transferase CaiB-like acyl-CoA transferase